jgi:excisionase family DNA binding protein
MKTITVPEAARESGVLVNYLYALLASGRLKGEKVNGQWALKRSDFESWRKQHRFYQKSRQRAAQHSSTSQVKGLQGAPVRRLGTRTGQIGELERL